MFKISQEPLEQIILKTSLLQPEAGALVTFEGRVRNYNNGKKVLALTYECYEPLALAEGAQILQEAKSQFDVFDIYCIHRIGQLQVGDMAVWSSVSAEHREAAFKACQYIIAQLKMRVPIWKKEFYINGNCEWVHCPHIDEPILAAK